MLLRFLPLFIFVFVVLAGITLVSGWHRKGEEIRRNRAEAINWGEYVLRTMGTAKKQSSRFRQYLYKHTYFLTGDPVSAKHMADQTVRWMITLFLLGVGFGALFRSPVWMLIGASMSVWPLYQLKQQYYHERQVFYRDLQTGGYIAFPHMVQNGVSLEDCFVTLARVGSGRFRRVMEEVCWLSGLPVLKNGAYVRLRAKPLTLIEALERVKEQSDSVAFHRWVRRIKLALDKQVSIANALFEDGQRLLEERQKKRDHLKRKVHGRLKYIVDMGMPGILTMFVMLQLTSFLHFVLSMVNKLSIH